MSPPDGWGHPLFPLRTPQPLTVTMTHYRPLDWPAACTADRPVNVGPLQPHAADVGLARTEDALAPQGGDVSVAFEFSPCHDARVAEGRTRARVPACAGDPSGRPAPGRGPRSGCW